MAVTKYHNITGSSGINVTLLSPGDGADGIKSVVIANTHATADATVSLFLQDNPSSSSPSTFYIFKTVAIPSDTSMILDDKGVLSFDNTTNGYGLYMTVGSSDTLDVLINL